jgi:K(+)-stimulated pyrophosphate-energized sodium pump
MMLPGLLTIGFPIAVVLIGKLVYQENNMLVAEMLGGYMAGVTVSGVLWAIFQNNAGGAWDNAKKSFEAGVEINGEMTYKGSDAHKASVTGDTVGDPFKDTSGPSMNILIKLTCLIGLVIAPILGGHSAEVALTDHNGTKMEITENGIIETVEVTKEVKVSMSEQDGMSVAEVTIETTKGGETTTETKTFTGTEEEVKAQIEALKNVDVKVKAQK